VKISSGNPVNPVPVTIGQLKLHLNDPTSPESLQSQLVELDKVEFDPASRNKTLADAVGKTSVDHLLYDCSGRSLTVRTSGRANFASARVPDANGRIIGVVSQFNSALQLGLRRWSDISMSAPVCMVSGEIPVNQQTFTLVPPVHSLNETFEAAINNINFESGGWINYNYNGSHKWKGNIKQNLYKALRASSYGTGETNTIWLISPPVIYHPGLQLSFKTGSEFWIPGHPDAITAFVSTDFNGSNFKEAAWIELNASLTDGSGNNYTGSGGLTASGPVQLSSMELFKNYNGNFVLAFRYSGTPKFTSNIYLDDILLE
jgi:hypothetical protein